MIYKRREFRVLQREKYYFPIVYSFNFRLEVFDFAFCFFHFSKTVSNAIDTLHREYIISVRNMCQ